MLLDQLGTATETNCIDGYETHVFGDEICLCQHCRDGSYGDSLCNTALELASWHEGTVSSTGFRERVVDSEVTSEQYRVVVPPELAIGIYLDGSLAGVFPCTAGSTQFGVTDFLTELLNDSNSTDVARDSRRTHRPSR